MEKGQVKRGFKHFRNTIKNNPKAIKNIRSCTSCMYFYEDDLGECCHNNSVTKFDVVEDGERVYCSYWTANWQSK